MFYSRKEAKLNKFTIQKGLIFIKPPRVAGGSTVRYLYDLSSKNGIQKRQNKKYSRGVFYENEKIDSDRNYIFTICRNPWDRFISSLKYYCKDKRKNLQKDFLVNGKLEIQKYT